MIGYNHGLQLSLTATWYVGLPPTHMEKEREQCYWVIFHAPTTPGQIDILQLSMDAAGEEQLAAIHAGCDVLRVICGYSVE